MRSAEEFFNCITSAFAIALRSDELENGAALTVTDYGFFQGVKLKGGKTI